MPQTFKSDNTWSYEAGAKLRLLDNRLQLNTAVFYTDWNQIQTAVSLPTVTGVVCAYSYTVNAAKAVSQGVDLSANFRLFQGLTGSVSATYNDAHYVGDLRAPALPGKVGGLLINNGDTLPTPPWAVTVGLQYDRNLWGQYDGYLRGDYQYQSAFKDASGFGPGTSSYVPDAINGSQLRQVSMRAGVKFKGLDFSVFANNLTGLHDMLGSITQGGRSGCSTAACTTFSRYNPVFVGNFLRPREIGVALAYRY